MTATVSHSRPFIPGTTGWSARDLEDPSVDALWALGSYEIVEGVLTTMPAAYFEGGRVLNRLMRVVEKHLEAIGSSGEFAPEVDIVIDEPRVARADAVLMMPEDQDRQREAAQSQGHADPQRTCILVSPTLIIESVSPGHESHDSRTKKRWYAEFGVPNYWVLDAFSRSLECFMLKNRTYRKDCRGRDNDAIRPAVFPGLVMDLAALWSEAPPRTGKKRGARGKRPR